MLLNKKWTICHLALNCNIAEMDVNLTPHLSFPYLDDDVTAFPRWWQKVTPTPVPALLSCGDNTSQEPRPTCWWKWVGRTKGVKSGISTLTANISAKFQCFHQSRAFFGTAHAWIFRIHWENEKRFTNIVTGAPRVSSSSFARIFLQFRHDLFGFVTYGFLTVHLSDLFHLSIRGVLQLRNVVLMSISKLIKPQINLI